MANMVNRTTSLLAVVAVVAAAACTRHIPSPPTTTNTLTATSAPAPQPAPAAELQPGVRSPLADVRLPAGAVFVGSSSAEEVWRYSAPYDETVTFVRKQFATGRKYDTHGATWWRNLPPCYDDKDESPPQGWVMENATFWLWTDGSISLSVKVFAPSSKTTPNEIVIDYTRWDNAYVWLMCATAVSSPTAGRACA